MQWPQHLCIKMSLSSQRFVSCLPVVSRSMLLPTATYVELKLIYKYGKTQYYIACCIGTTQVLIDNMCNCHICVMKRFKCLLACLYTLMIMNHGRIKIILISFSINDMQMNKMCISAA